MGTKILRNNETGSVLIKAYCTDSREEYLELLQANSTDGAGEKHVPVVEIADGLVKVKVGAVEHPMAEDHFITFIVLQTKKSDQIVRLKPGEKPEAVFAIAPGDEPVAAYEYCNKHGLWKTEL